MQLIPAKGMKADLLGALTKTTLTGKFTGEIPSNIFH
jgi:hypothetical protein